MTHSDPNYPPPGKDAKDWTDAERDAFWNEQNEKAKRVQAIVVAALAPWAECSEMMTYRQWYRIEGYVRAAVEMADYFGNGAKVDVTIERVRAARKYSPNDRWSVNVKVVANKWLNDPTKATIFAVQGWAHIGKHGKVDGTLWDLTSNRYFGDQQKRARKAKKA